eukprot:CAMPEP_0194495176 /NCGR_PEP_ID=MMETSP0253-20130528/12865_1 /TAXON_ID=2966 /ORGANISM="Noctiluca scintillans" /LENGTH=288 /DNA_ID=CAMNT_0039336395 /DNA_START=270 /DNA_END=1136 /DNA_ORIENTATION=+
MAEHPRVAVVTGTNSGVGLSLSVLLAKDGFQVFAGMRGVSSEKSAPLHAAVAEAGVDVSLVETIELDVNSDESVTQAFEAILQKTGRVDVLVNNAGYSIFGSVEQLGMDAIQAQFNTNVYGVIRCQKAVLGAMRQQRSGKIINISSVGGVWGQPFNDVYCASKFAIEGLAESQAPLFRTFGVYVTNVQPGGIKTNFATNAKLPDMSALAPEYAPALQSTFAAYKGSTASQTPEEVAQQVMDQVVRVEAPPLKVQPNAAIAAVFKAQLADPTGEAGVAMAKARFIDGSV